MAMSELLLALADNGFWIKRIERGVYAAKNSRDTYYLYERFAGVDGVSICLVSGGQRKTHPVPAKDVISWGAWGFSFNDTRIKITAPETGHKI